MKRASSVDEYIANAPDDVRDTLREMRRVIRSVAPQAEEKISYGMPYYGYKGRLVYFAYFKNHIGLYIPTPTLAEYKNELKDYVTAKATVQFPLKKELPLGLIKRLVKSRVQWNDEQEKKQ